MTQFLPPPSSSLKTKTLLSPFLLFLKPTHLHSLSSISPSSSSSSISQETCLNLLSHCNSNSLKQGICAHSPIIKLCLHSNLLLINTLLSLYTKCFTPHHAHHLFDEMPQRDVVSWTSVISSYVQSRLNDQALLLFQHMLLSGFLPNQFTYSSAVRCASAMADFDLGTCVHARIVKQGFESNVVLSSGLLDFYSKCDGIGEALQIFEHMGYRDAVSWTSMISALVEAGDWSGSLKLFMSMIDSRVSPNEFTFVKVLVACSFLGLKYGEMVHGQLIVRGIRLNLIVKTALVDMYCKCLNMGEASKVFRQTPDSDVMLWTAMISGHNLAGDCKQAILVFKAMEIAGVSPNSFTFAAILNASTALPVLELGMQIHSMVTKFGIEHDLSVGNALVDLYSKLSPSSDDPVHAFEELRSPNVVSWTALIGGFSRHGQAREVLLAFTEMLATGVTPDTYTISNILKVSCSSSEAVFHTMRTHAYVLKTNLNALDVDLVMGNSLVDAYARSMRIDDAYKVANPMDIFTYTSLARSLNQMGLHGKAVNLIIPIFHKNNLKIDGFILATFLSSIAGLARIEPGKQLHCYSVKSGLNGWISVSNGLIDMYSKCGRIEEAQRAFRAIQNPNVVSWNGLISGLASNGHFSDALSAFEDMRLAGTKPDTVTMLVVLYACSHGGLVDLGVEYFNSMTEMYGVNPQFDHYVCLVDLLGRAGRLEEAACAIETMEVKVEEPLIYKTLLNCCRMHGNLVMGECMAKRAMEMDPSDPAVYVMLAGLYDDAGKVKMGEEVRRMMRERGLSKCPGQSWA